MEWISFLAGFVVFYCVWDFWDNYYRRKKMKQPHRFVSNALTICNRCKTGNLHWVEMANGQWRLHDEKDRIHRCKNGIWKGANK